MKIVIVGAGENGHQAFHCLRHDKSVEMVGFIDDNPANRGGTKLGLPIIGTTAELPALIKKYGLGGGIAAIGKNKGRAALNEKIRAAGLKVVKAIHPQVMIESPESIGDGVVLEMGAAVHAGAVIGEGVFMGSASMAAHHCVIGDYTTVSGGVNTGGGVTVGRFTLLGVGCSIRDHFTIGSNVIVGVGAAVVKDVPDNVVVAGVPAKILRELDPNSST